jgi:proline iminopeptidase
LELLSSLDITSRLSQNNRDSLLYWNQQIARGDTSYDARLKRGKYLAPAYLYDDSLVPIVAERLTQGNMAINRLVFRDLRRIDYDTKAELKNYTQPVLVIQGKHDIIPISISRKAHQLFPNSTLLVLDHASHYGWLEEPETYFSAIDVFMESIKP